MLAVQGSSGLISSGRRAMLEQESQPWRGGFAAGNQVLGGVGFSLISRSRSASMAVTLHEARTSVPSTAGVKMRRHIGNGQRGGQASTHGRTPEGIGLGGGAIYQRLLLLLWG